MNLVEYSYLGLDTMVRANYSGQPGVELTYLQQSGDPGGDAGDRYTGLDRFGRVVDQRWLKTSTDTPLERVQYGFDRAGNRNFRDNRVAASGQDEYYTNDGLSQLKALQRGDLNANRTGISGTPVWEENFNYDPTGNWHGSATAYLTKSNGTTELDQNRSHNPVNELTGITTTSGPAWVTPVHDRAGNMTTIPQPNAPTNSYTCTYDAWNRLVEVKAGGSTVATYRYDGQNRRTTKTTGGNTRHFYYSEKWQVLEERADSATTADRQFV
jgi:YD repeat-containing protein